MPHLRFRGVADAALDAPFAALMRTLPEAFDCPPDWISAELVATTFLTPVAPMTEILWFERGAGTRDRVATLVTDAFRAAGVAMTVVFVPLAKEHYYEDGRRFA